MDDEVYMFINPGTQGWDSWNDTYGSFPGPSINCGWCYEHSVYSLLLNVHLNTYISTICYQLALFYASWCWLIPCFPPEQYYSGQKVQAWHASPWSESGRCNCMKIRVSWGTLFSLLTSYMTIFFLHKISGDLFTLWHGARGESQPPPTPTHPSPQRTAPHPPPPTPSLINFPFH